MDCELKTARKIFWLLAHDHIFLSAYNEEKGGWDEGLYPSINCNDVFVPAADAEGLKAEELDMYIEACRRWPQDAAIAWVAVKRSAKPWRLTTGPEYEDAKLGIKAMLCRKHKLYPVTIVGGIINLLWGFVWHRWMFACNGDRRRVVRVKGWRTAVVESRYESRQVITPCFTIFGIKFD